MFYRGLVLPIFFIAASFFATVWSPAARADDYQDYQNHITQAELAKQRGDGENAFRNYLAALADYPNADLPENSLIGMLSNGLPEQMDPSILQSLPAASLPYTVSSFDLPDGDSGEPPHATLVVPRSSVPLHEATDPENGWPFSHVLYVYRSSGTDSEKASLLCAVHYQTLDDQSLARRTGSLLILLREAYQQKMGKAPLGDTHSFQVWLCRRAPDTGGGEEWHNNLYFYDTGDKRSSIEWIREIAHEYSHLAFPAIGGNYTDPEAWANGYIGEQLLIRWISRGAGGGPAALEQVWGETFTGYANFERILIAPDEHLYLAQGLSKKWLERTDAVGMRYLIGLLLWMDDHQGPQYVGNLLYALNAHHQTSPDSLYVPVLSMIHHAKPATTSGREAHASA